MIYHNAEDNITSKALQLHYGLEAGARPQQSSHGLHSRSAKALGPKDKELWTVNDRLAIKI